MFEAQNKQKVKLMSLNTKCYLNPITNDENRIKYEYFLLEISW